MEKSLARRVLTPGLSSAARVLTRADACVQDAARAARFLHGAAEFESRPDDVFVSSYPRSGTTWVQFILYLLTSDRRVDFRHISEVQPWFERSLALGSRTAADFRERPSPRVFKSHLPRRWLPKTGRFVYVFRRVEDVLVSYYEFYRSHLAYADDFGSFVERFVAGRLQYGSWWKHVFGWMRFRDDPTVKILRYEDLKRAPDRVISELATFLMPGHKLERAVLDDVLEKARFDSMKREEHRFDPVTELLIDRGHIEKSFLRAGRVGGRALDEETRRRLEEAENAAKMHVRPDVELRLAAFLH
ncbi:MAG: sulfotransferase domain-containing protein [Deltaproteobacteria bacterium]|nr:sulfotransferase domain-containing protein [Deltaproteobacteria bacterium]